MLAVTDTGTAFNVNVAVTLDSTVRGIEQGLVPEQFAFPMPWFQPAKVDPFAAFAVKITVPCTN